MPQQWHVNCLSDIVFAGKLTGLRVSSSQPILMLVYVVSTTYLKVCMYCCFSMLVDYVTDVVGSLLQLVHPVLTNIARKVCNLLQKYGKQQANPDCFQSAQVVGRVWNIDNIQDLHAFWLPAEGCHEL